MGAIATAVAEKPAADVGPPPSEGGVSLLDRAAWRDAALVWAAQRVVFAALTYLGWLLPITHDAVVGTPWSRPLLPWATFHDGLMYPAIARVGYHDLWQAAFFPLLPLLEHALSPFPFSQPEAAGLFVANAACLPAFALLGVLTERELGRAAARRALLYLALFPTALFFAAAYTESIFLLLSVGAFLALRGRRWLVAGTLAAAATLTRQVGIVLLVPLAVEIALTARRARPGRAEALRMAAGLAAPVVALAAFCLYLYARYGTPFANAEAEAGTWGHHLSWPWYGMVHAARAAVGDHGSHQVIAFVDLALMLAAVLVAVALLLRRALPAAYALYACAMLLVVLVEPLQGMDWAALQSQPRYLLVIFPLFWCAATLRARPVVRWAFVAGSAWLLAVFVLGFVNGTWVA